MFTCKNIFTTGTKAVVLNSFRQLNIQHLKKRTLLQLTGPDTANYLQSMITNDVKKVELFPAMYSMILNPSGRVLYDLILYQLSKTDYLVEYDATGAPYLHRHLLMYRLRKDVKIQPLSDLSVWVVYKDFEKNMNFSVNESRNILTQLENTDGIIHHAADPRNQCLGFRIITKNSTDAHVLLKDSDLNLNNADSYDSLRYRLGIGEGVLDHPPGHCMPLDTNLDLLNGVSFTKGCYIGQEVAAKSNFVMSIRKRLMPIIFEKRDSYPQFPPECNVLNENNKKLGRLRSHDGQYGLGLLKYEDCKKAKYLILEGFDIKLQAEYPSWWPPNLSSDKNEHIFSI